jgi:hypothetical protein
MEKNQGKISKQVKKVYEKYTKILVLQFSCKS